MSRETLAAEIQMSLTTITSWENFGPTNAEMLERLARTLGCSLDWLILGEGEPYRSTGADGIEGAGRAFGQRLRPSPELAPQSQARPQTPEGDEQTKPSSDE